MYFVDYYRDGSKYRTLDKRRFSITPQGRVYEPKKYKTKAAACSAAGSAIRHLGAEKATVYRIIEKWEACEWLENAS